MGTQRWYQIPAYNYLIGVIENEPKRGGYLMLLLDGGVNKGVSSGVQARDY